MAGRGRPSREEMLKNREDKMKRDLAEQVMKGKELAVEHYFDYVSAIDEYARGTIKGTSHTNRISSIKYMLEYCEKALEEEAAKKSTGDGEDKPVEKTKETKPKANLLSMAY